MKKIIVALICILFSSVSLADENIPSIQEITTNIINSATNYANSISCGDVEVQPKQIAALVPYKDLDHRDDAKYAVLWDGDIGCMGGSGTTATNISIVGIGTNNAYFIDPLKSSPVIHFDSPVTFVERLVGNTNDTLVLEGMEAGPNDAHCCPSIKVRFKLKVDKKDNWKLIDKKVIPNAPVQPDNQASGASKNVAPYPIPSLNFGKVDLLGAVKRAGMEPYWITHFINYLSEPTVFWNECMASEKNIAQTSGGLNQKDAKARGESACKSIAQQHYECFNGKALDDAVLCLQTYINNVAENGE